MHRITFWLSLCLTALWLGATACSGGTTTGVNSCQADRNCLANEKCYQGKCVLASQVPNNNNTTGNTNNTNQNNTNTNQNNTNTNQNNTNTPKEDYPPGPYGADVGDVAIPLALENCDGSVKMNFKDYYKHPKIKVLLVTVHTGWCPSCKKQASGLEAFYQRNKEYGLGIISVVTEDERQGQGLVPVAWCQSHKAKYRYSFELWKDPRSEQFRQYFDRNAVPLNMIISTKDMKIVYKQSGALEDRLEGIVESYVR